MTSKQAQQQRSIDAYARAFTAALCFADHHHHTTQQHRTTRRSRPEDASENTEGGRQQERRCLQAAPPGCGRLFLPFHGGGGGSSSSYGRVEGQRGMQQQVGRGVMRPLGLGWAHTCVERGPRPLGVAKQGNGWRRLLLCELLTGAH
jgi:hypothetical protein